MSIKVDFIRRDVHPLRARCPHYKHLNVNICTSYTTESAVIFELPPTT
ncbi:MAG: hypothetical protein F6K08_30575 [Okeania sp. SIO1H6]|nr:hypothetical protein [Okeania sp. SIO1H6]